MSKIVDMKVYIFVNAEKADASSALTYKIKIIL